MKNITQNKTRREFLTMVLGAAVVVPVLTRLAPDLEPHPAFESLIRRFDRKSIEDKQKFVEGFSTAKFNATRSDTQELAAECNLILKEMGFFFQKRLAASLAI